MKYLVLIFSIFILASCSEVLDIDCSKSSNVKYNSIAMYGDSNCAACGSAADRSGIEKQCKNGRKLIDVEYIDSKYDLVFLALGINDIGSSIPVSEYYSQLEYLIEISDSHVICVLPNSHPTFDSSPYRQAMIDICVQYIDPASDCGTKLDYGDRVHYNQNDQILLSGCMNNYIDDFLTDTK